jgi:hypothetical protein
MEICGYAPAFSTGMSVYGKCAKWISLSGSGRRDLLQGGNYGSHHAPDFKAHGVVYDNGQVFIVFGQQVNAVVKIPDTLYQTLPVDNGNDDFIIGGKQGAVNRKDGAVEYPRFFHGVAAYAHKEGGSRPFDQVFVQVQFEVNKIIRRAGKSGRNRATVDGQSKRLQLIGRFEYFDYAHTEYRVFHQENGIYSFFHENTAGKLFPLPVTFREVWRPEG